MMSGRRKSAVIKVVEDDQKIGEITRCCQQTDSLANYPEYRCLHSRRRSSTNSNDCSSNKSQQLESERVSELSPLNTSMPGLLMKRRKRKANNANALLNTGEQTIIAAASTSTVTANTSTVTVNTTFLENYPVKVVCLASADATRAGGSQNLDAVSEKSAKKKGNMRRTSVKQEQECVEVYVRKISSTDSSLISNSVDSCQSGIQCPDIAVLNTENGADEEEAQNAAEAMINNVLESAFFNIKDSEVYSDKENRNIQYSDDDDVLHENCHQRGVDRQDQIHEGITEHACTVFNQTGNSTSELLVSEHVTVPALASRVVLSESMLYGDSVELSEGEDRASVCSESAAEVLPERLASLDLSGCQLLEEKSGALDCSSATPPPLSPPQRSSSPKARPEMFPDEIFQTDPEQSGDELRTLAASNSFATRSLKVTSGCDTTDSDAKQSSTLSSPCVSPEFVKKNRRNSIKRKLFSRKCHIRNQNSLEKSGKLVDSKSIELRKDRVKSCRPPEIKTSVEVSSIIAHEKATVSTSTVTKQTRRTATRRKATAEQICGSEPETFQTVVPVKSMKSKTIGVEPLSVQNSGSVVVKTSRTVVRRQFDSNYTDGTKPTLVENVLKPVSIKKFISKPVLAEKSISKVNAAEKSVVRPVFVKMPKLLEPPCLGSEMESDELQYSDSNSIVMSPSGLRNRFRTKKRRAKILCERPLGSQTNNFKSLLDEPAQKISCQIAAHDNGISSTNTQKISCQIAAHDNGISSTNTENVCSFKQTVQKDFDVVCASQDVASSSQVAIDADQNTKGDLKHKSTEAVIIPPLEYVRFKENGDLEISDIITNAIPLFVASGCTQVYILIKNVTLLSSGTQENLAFAVDLNSSPFKFIPSTSFLNKSNANKLTTEVEELHGSQVGETICEPQLSCGESSDLEIKNSPLSINDMTALCQRESMTPSPSEHKIIDHSMANWTCLDTSAWLTLHGLSRLVPSFSNINGTSLIELVHYSHEDLEIISQYLKDMGTLLIDQVRLFDVLRTTPIQSCEGPSSLLSSGRSQAGPADYALEAAGAKDVAAANPRRRARRSRSNRKQPAPSSGASSSPPAMKDSSSAFSHWTDKDVSAWLTSHGLDRFIQDFSRFDGQGLAGMANLLNTHARTVHRMIYNTGFTLSESLKFCACLRVFSRGQECLCSLQQ